MCVNVCFSLLHTLAESGSHDDTSRLIQLVLGIAINCEHKDSELNTFTNSYKCNEFYACPISVRETSVYVQSGYFTFSVHNIHVLSTCICVHFPVQGV